MFEELLLKENLKVNLIDVLSLAFLGDAVHSLFIRTMLVTDKDYKQKDLQRITSKIVCASNQSLTLSKIEPNLSEEEIAITKRARNAHNNNRAKNSTASDYKRSTAYEALIGYLYLKNQTERMMDFLKISVEIANNKEQEN